MVVIYCGCFICIYILWLLHIIFSTVVVMYIFLMCGVDFLPFMMSSVKSASPTKTKKNMNVILHILLTINPLYQYETHSHCFIFQSQ